MFVLRRSSNVVYVEVLATRPPPQDTNYTATCLPSRTKTIQVRRTRHAVHCWRSKDELISDVLLWTPTYGQANAGRPARTYTHQLSEDTGCNPEDLPEAMNNREKWRERVRDIRAGGTTWWWWWWWCVSPGLVWWVHLKKLKDAMPITTQQSCMFTMWQILQKSLRTEESSTCSLPLGCLQMKKKIRKWSCSCASWQPTY